MKLEAKIKVTLIALGVNIAVIWGRRLITWRSESILPGLLSPSVFVATELAAVKILEVIFSRNRDLGTMAIGHLTHQWEQIRMISYGVGIAVTTLLTPYLSKRLGFTMSRKASLFFALPSIPLSWILCSPSRNNGY